MNEFRVDNSAEETIIFREFTSINEAEIVRSVLENYGIWSTINNEYMSAFYPLGVIYAQIIIRKEDFERAKALVTL